MADSDLTTPATVAAELGVTVSDPRLARIVAAASAAIRRYLNRPRMHYSAGFVEKLPGFGRPRLVVGLTPVVSVASIVLGDGTVVPVSEYEVEDADNGFIWRDACWPWTAGIHGGLLYSDPAVGTEKADIVATYTGGWVTPAQAATIGWSGPARSLPDDLEHACVETAVSVYRRGGADRDVQSESLGDYSVSYRGEVSAGGIVPAAVLPQLDAWRRPLG